MLIGYQLQTEIIIIINITHHQLGLDIPVFASSNSLFNGLPSRLFLTWAEEFHAALISKSTL